MKNKYKYLQVDSRQMDEITKNQTLAYLKAGPIVLWTPGKWKPGAINPGFGYYTDGEWIWASDDIDKIEKNETAPSEDFVNKVRSLDSVPEVSENEQKAICDFIVNAANEE